MKMFRKKKKDEGPCDCGRDENECSGVNQGAREPFRGPFFGKDPFADFFSDFSGIERMMNDLMKNMASGQGGMRMGKPFVYGFSMKTGPDGKPIISEFGNVSPGKVVTGNESGIGPVVRDAREPLVDVIDGDDGIAVIAELPGVEKKDIDLEIDGESLIISANTPNKKYYKEVRLPGEVKDDASNASYNNGILEVRLKRASKKKKGKKIEIK
jgi:HSP20 family protein